MASEEEQAAQLPARGALSWSGRHAREVLAGLLLTVALAGLRAAVPATGAGAGPWNHDVLPLAGAFEFLLAVLLAALRLIARRRPHPGYLAAALRAGLVRAIVLGMATVAVLTGLSRLHLHPGHPTRTSVHPAPTLLRPRGLQSAAAQHAASLTYLLYALLALLLLGAIVACVLAVVRQAAGEPAGEVLAVPDDDAQLRAAVESGRRALRSFDDAQAAIIACYVAMEASLASAGTGREAAETPGELLARTVGSGLLQGTAAGRLTALFYEARYSSHALPATARDEAVRALDAISAELTRRGEGSRLSGTPALGSAP